MTGAAINGITFGLLLAIMIGPVFFALIRTSLHEGFRGGFFLATGVLLCDLLLISFCYWFADKLLPDSGYKTSAGIAGGLVLIGFGIYNFFRKVNTAISSGEKTVVHARFALHGFMLNLFNPAVLLFWLGVTGMIAAKDDFNTSHRLMFLGTMLATVFLTDVLKAYIAHRIRNLLSPAVMKWMNRISGIALVIFGIRALMMV